MMIFRKICLTFLGLSSLIIISLTFGTCLTSIKNGGPTETGMIFLVYPLPLIIIGILRFLISKKIKLNIVFKLQDFAYALLIYLPMINYSFVRSMKLGLGISLTLIIACLIGILYPLTVFNGLSFPKKRVLQQR